MKRVLKDACAIGISLIIIFLVFFLNNDVGIHQSKVEKDARKSQKIAQSWEVAKDSSKSMVAMFFYDESLSQHIFSIYVNRNGFSFGYFFRGGGSIGTTMDDIIEFKVEDCKDSAYLSMNKHEVSEIKIEKGKDIETIEGDSNKPFAVVLPAGGCIITFYDINGNVIESLEYKL